LCRNDRPNVHIVFNCPRRVNDPRVFVNAIVWLRYHRAYPDWVRLGEIVGGQRVHTTTP